MVADVIRYTCLLGCLISFIKVRLVDVSESLGSKYTFHSLYCLGSCTEDSNRSDYLLLLLETLGDKDVGTSTAPSTLPFLYSEPASMNCFNVLSPSPHPMLPTNHEIKWRGQRKLRIECFFPLATCLQFSKDLWYWSTDCPNVYLEATIFSPPNGVALKPSV